MKLTTTATDLLDMPDPAEFLRLWKKLDAPPEVTRAALHTAEMSALVYRSEAEFREGVKAAGYTDGMILDREPSQLGLAWAPGLISLVPRGSQGGRELWRNRGGDWRDNLDLRAVKWLSGKDLTPIICPEAFAVSRPVKRNDPFPPPGIVEVRPHPLGPKLALFEREYSLMKGRVTAGMKRHFRRVRDVVGRQLLNRWKEDPGARVVIMGHSLGGAQVPLWGAVAEEALNIPVHSMFPWNMPRLFNKKGAKAFNERYGTRLFRGVHIYAGQPDEVSRWPKSELWWPMPEFRHVGQVVLFDRLSRWFGESAWEDYRARNPVSMLRSLRFITNRLRGIEAHKMLPLNETLKSQVLDD